MSYIGGYVKRPGGYIGGFPAQAVRPLVSGLYLDPRFTFTRAQLAGVEVMSPDASGIWRPYAADQPIYGADGRLLFGRAAGTNLIANARAEGGVPGIVGAGGVLPGGVNIFSADGLSTEFIGSISLSGLPGIRVRIFGAPVNTFYVLSMGGITSGIVALAPYTASLSAALVSGTSPGLLQVQNRLSTGSITTFFTDLTASPQRKAATGTTTASTTNTFNTLSITEMTVGASVDFTVDLAAACLFQSAVDALPKLPPIGAPAISTAGLDVLTAPLAPLGVSSGSTWWFDTEMLVPVGARTAMLCLDDGTVDNNIVFERRASGQAAISRTTGGVTTTTDLGAMASNVRYGVAVTDRGDGTARAVVHALGAGEVSGAPTAPTTVRRDGLSDGTAAGVHASARTRRLPYPVDNDMLAALAAQAVA